TSGTVMTTSRTWVAAAPRHSEGVNFRALRHSDAKCAVLRLSELPERQARAGCSGGRVYRIPWIAGHENRAAARGTQRGLRFAAHARDRWALVCGPSRRADLALAL